LAGQTKGERKGRVRSCTSQPSQENELQIIRFTKTKWHKEVAPRKRRGMGDDRQIQEPAQFAQLLTQSQGEKNTPLYAKRLIF